MAELATIARPYAEALFEVSHGDLTATQGWLDAIAATAGAPQLLQFAANPKVNAAEVFRLVASVLPQPLPEHGANFLRAVIDNDRLAALPEVAKQFRELANAQSGRSDAQIYSAFPIADAELAGLKAVLEKRFGRRLETQVHVDPELIGGVRVVVGDEVLDTSVKARLQQMKSALTA
ncbi:MAG: F0F1 ATP synthase subunit delta [Desulfovibrionaceae bacterium]|jgi:F-type H+-transporting ATPase subunit delta|nr:F0F1 ATP synthase subunit delta [Desulfovibrionaceae bacterium]